MSLEKKIQLRPSEEIDLVVRRAGATFAWRYILGFGILFATSFYLFWFLSQGWWGTVVVGLGFLVGVYIILHAWFFWKNNMLVITNERVIDINRLGWFEELISAAAYNDIKDIYLHRKGFFASIFNYATVVIESKSQRALLELPAVSEPEKVLALMLDKNDQYESHKGLLKKQAVYERFLQIVPELSEAELCEVLDLVDLRLANMASEVTEVPIEVDQDEEEVV